MSRLADTLLVGATVRTLDPARPTATVIAISDGTIVALDDETLEELWSINVGTGVNAHPITYAVDGKQYIVVGAGGNTQIDFKRGNNIIAFTVD